MSHNECVDRGRPTPEGGVMLLDARPLKLIRRLSLGTGKTCMRNQPHSIERHRIDSQPCQCHTLHGHCYAVACPCPRHVGEIM